MYIIWPIPGVFATGTTEGVCLHEVAACVIALPACLCCDSIPFMELIHGAVMDQAKYTQIT